MALIIVTMTMLLVTAVGAALVLTTSSDALISANFRESQQARYAADAAAEWVLVDLAAVVDDWPTLLNTSVKSWFVDGVASGWRALPDGSHIDLGAIVLQNESWQPYAYGLVEGPLAPAGYGAPAIIVLRCCIRISGFGAPRRGQRSHRGAGPTRSS